MYTLAEIQAMSPEELKAATKHAQKAVAINLIAFTAIKVGVVILIRQSMKRYWWA